MMLISFFEGTDVPIIGVDCTNYPGLIIQENIDFDPKKQTPTLQDGRIVLIDVPMSETPEEKYARIFEKLVNLPTLDASTDQSVLEGLVFSDKQKGDLIVARVFKDPVTGEPNPHFQTAMLAKKLLGNNEPEFLQMLQHTQQQTDAILAFFKMGKL